LAERMSRMTTATLRDRLKDDEAEMRRAAALAAAMKEETAHIPRLIELLDDSDTAVSRAAHAALKSLSGKDFGPAKEATRADQAHSIAAWKAWWKEKDGK
jgi:HEAT repeat protein